ncbi:sporulation-control protein [Seinonella peptonophila]|uniref:Sporulation-control protein n=1 Tax=Seinonella peptonophila TaxID=112248 RepID=A0A1M4SMA9_9BACL|nr:sporulation-control protein [Seinonella peptonophila]
MFKKFLAKLGKGSTTVDLVIDKHEYKLGEQIFGQIVLKGGTIEQYINKLEVELTLRIAAKEQHYSQLIQSFVFDEPFKIQPEEEKHYPFHYELPYNLLITGPHISYDFVTHLDIKGGVDSTDRDPITIQPPDHLQNILFAFEQLGFREKYDSRSFDGSYQEFELTPTTYYHDQIEELEFNVIFEETGIALLLELDLYSFLGEKEIHRELFIEHDLLNNVEQLTSYFQQIIDEMIASPAQYHHSDKKHLLSKYPVTKILGGAAVGLIAAGLLKETIDDIDDLVDDNEDDNTDYQDDDEGFSFFDDDED